MLENSARKPPTNFTIDCILSKKDNQNGEHTKSPTANHPRNRVLDNPWISKCPLSLTFNPSSHRKLNTSSPTTVSALSPNQFNLYKPPSFSDNVVRVTQHFTSVHNHFYPVAASTSSDSTISSDDFSLLPKSSVYDNRTNSCDKKLICNSLSLGENLMMKHETPSPITPNPMFKCSVCSKTFDSNEILDVSLNDQRPIEPSEI